MKIQHLTLLILLTFSLFSVPIQAQDNDDCPVLVEEALAIVGEACAGVGRNQACYGHSLVVVTRFDQALADEFTNTGDTIDVGQLASLVTAPLNVDENTWGIAVLALQVNLPNTLPGQNVTFLIYGDIELVNEVAPDGEHASPITLSARSTGDINLRSGPGTSYAIVGVLSADQDVAVVGRNQANDWVQVYFGSTSAWAYAPLLTIDGDVTMVTVAAADTMVSPSYTAPMQAFRFISGVGGSACEEAPKDGLLIQAPTDTTVNFMINGVEITVGSTALLQVDDDLLSVNTFDGVVNITSANQTQTAEPGYQVIVTAGVPPTEPEPYDYDDVRTAPVEALPVPVDIPITVGFPGQIDSGVTLTAGQTYTITASGFIHTWPDCETEKAGAGIPDYDCAISIVGPGGGSLTAREVNPTDGALYPMPDENLGILLGQIGSSEVFVIGEGGTFTADADGTLQLLVNDLNAGGGADEGAFVVVIKTGEEE